MNDEIYTEYPRLAALVDQLCDRELDQAGADELNRIVTSDERAREWYVRYLMLHASLHWDLGLPPVSTPVEFAPQQTAPVAPVASGMHAVMRELLDDLELTFAAKFSHAAAEVSPGIAAHDVRRPQPAVPFWRQRWGRPVGGAVAAVLLLLLVVAVVPRDSVNSPSEGPEIAQLDNTRPSPTDLNDSAPAENTTVTSERSPSETLPPELPRLDWDGLARQVRPGGKPEESPPALVNSPSPPAGPAGDVAVVDLINREIVAAWQDQQVTPSRAADDYEWVRRVYLDLAGRIPTSSEVQTFLTDRSLQRDADLVNRLLESEEFALQWSSRWTNLLVGRTPEARVDRISLQSFLKDSVAEHRGWNQVVADLISAEGDPRENGAANFLVAHLNNEAVPATAFVARTLLGSQIHCAQCHKHPFYEVSQQEFWELNSFFKQTSLARMPGGSLPSAGMEGRDVYELRDQAVGGPTFFETRSGVMQVAYPKFNGQEVDPSQAVGRRKELARILATGDGQQISRAFVNRTWAQLFGYGLVNPVDDLGPHNPPTHPQLFSQLATAFVEADYDVQRLIRWIVLSRPYRLSSQLTARNAIDVPDRGELPLFSRMYFKPLSAEQLYDSLLVLRGDAVLPRDSWRPRVRERETWVNQFVNSLQNDENGEANHFDGTISQALVLMNGELVNETIATHRNPVIQELVRENRSDIEKLEALCLSVLSRKPSPDEIALFRKLSRPLRDVRSPSERDLLLAGRLEDVLWAYLNSSEFIMNH